MKSWYIQVAYKDQLKIVYIEKDTEPTRKEVEQAIRDFFGTKRLIRDQLSYAFC